MFKYGSTSITFLILPLGPRSLPYLTPDRLRSLLTAGVGGAKHDENVLFLQSRERECQVVDKVGMRGHPEPRGRSRGPLLSPWLCAPLGMSQRM